MGVGLWENLVGIGKFGGCGVNFGGCGRNLVGMGLTSGCGINKWVLLGVGGI